MTRRTERLASVIQEEITGLLLKGRLKDPRLHELTTITGVKVGKDLSQAKVFYTVLGDEAAVKESGLGLEAAKGFIQRHLAKHLSIRVIPSLSFEYDPSSAYGDKINRLLSTLPELRDGAAGSEEPTTDDDGSQAGSEEGPAGDIESSERE